MTLFFLFTSLSLICFSVVFIRFMNPSFELNGTLESGLMFFASGGEEKTEKPSAKKLQDARKKGQVIKSTDVNNLLLMIAAFALITTFGSLGVESIKNIMEHFFLHSYDTSLISSNSNSLFLLIITFCIQMAVLIFFPLMIIGVAANLMQTGFISSQEGLKPKFDKLNPISGFKNLFSRKQLLSGLKNILLLIIAGFISYDFIVSQQSDLLSLPFMRYNDALAKLGQIVSGFVIRLLVLVAGVAVFDYAIQRFEFMRSQKMTKQEMKEEYKQMEGDPFVKGQRRQKQREISLGGMIAAVSESTVVVTNPTHYAIAIKYVHDVDLIPIVVAKGLDFKAQKIKEIAKEHDVPVIENKPLARALYATAEVDQDIPLDLYKAVAEILAIVYKLEKKQNYY